MEDTEKNVEETEVATATPDLSEQVASRATKTKKAKKAAAKGSAPKAKGKKEPAVKKVGVISKIVEAISSKDGATQDEMVKALTKAFPDKDAEGMRTTVRIQMTRLPQKFGFEMKKFKDEKRGLVYKAPATLASQYAKGSKKDAA